MALDFNLVPEENHDAVVASLVKNATDWGTLRTGVLGTLSIYNALSEENYHKELLDITVTGDKCSFGYMLDNGATTLWEYWDRAYEGFNSLGANGVNTPAVWDSLNHCMMGGGLTTWMFEGLGGIRSTGPAFHTITYRPGLESELTYVNSSVDTMIGLTESDWTYENGVLDWTVTVPVNATAKIVIPIADRHADAAADVAAQIRAAGGRVEIYSQNEPMRVKIAKALSQKIPYMLVMGDKEIEEGTVGVRKRGEGDIGAMKVDEFLALVLKQNEEKVIF
jgi:hypothetical protein